MNILSLFDGISCGQIALERAEINIDKYFASEIDEYAIKITQYNYPNTIQLGDVTKINSKDLPKIDLLIGGSPCQGFSFAGKQLNFNDVRSSLFFEFVRLLNECKPKYFLLENVKMKKEYQDIISEYLGVKPIEINSRLVSAQDRKRLYWTNIPNVVQPYNQEIQLKNIFEKEIEDWHFLKPEIANRFTENKYKKVITKSCVCGKLSKYQGDRVFDIDCKGSSLSAVGGNNGGGSCNIIKHVDGRLRKLTTIECERLQTVPDNYTEVVSRNKRYSALGNGWTVDIIAHIFKNIQGE